MKKCQCDTEQRLGPDPQVEPHGEYRREDHARHGIELDDVRVEQPRGALRKREPESDDKDKRRANGERRQGFVDRVYRKFKPCFWWRELFRRNSEPSIARVLGKNASLRGVFVPCIGPQEGELGAVQALARVPDKLDRRLGGRTGLGP